MNAPKIEGWLCVNARGERFAFSWAEQTARGFCGEFDTVHALVRRDERIEAIVQAAIELHHAREEKEGAIEERVRIAEITLRNTVHDFLRNQK